MGYEERRSDLRAWLRVNVVEAFELPTDRPVIDVGCADGFWTSLFLDLGYEAFGIDRNSAEIEEGRRKYSALQDRLFVADYLHCRLPAVLSRMPFTVFARTLPEFFGVPDLSAFKRFVGEWAWLGVKTVMCIYSDESGANVEAGTYRHAHRTRDEYLAAAASVAPHRCRFAVRAVDGYVLLLTENMLVARPTREGV